MTIDTHFVPVRGQVPEVHFQVTHQESEGVASLPYARKFAYTYADLDSNHKFFIPIDAGTTILHLTHRVTTAFAGGTPSATVGDSGSTTKYLASSDISEVTLNDMADSLTAGSPVEPQYYASANYIVVTHASGLTDGAGELVVYYGA